jgi:hypothetical protein
MNEKNNGIGINGGDTISSDPGITRKQFISKIVKGAATTGVVMLAPKVLDKFILPAQAAGTSSCTVADTGAGRDQPTVGAHGSDVRTTPGFDTLCEAGA